MLWPLLLSLLWAAECTREKRVQRRSAGLPDSGYTLHMLKMVMVREGEGVLVPCGVSYPRSPSSSVPVLGFWFQDGADTNRGTPVATNKKTTKLKVKQNRFELVGDPENKNCSLLIRDAQRRDTGVYFFRVEAHPSVKYNYLMKKLCVCVTALHLQVPGALESSRTVQLNCSLSSDCSQCSTPIFSWTSAALTSLGPTTSTYSVLTLTAQPWDHGTNVICQVTFPEAGSTMQRTVPLLVPYAPRKLTVKVSWDDHTEPQVLHSGSSLRVQEGESLRLVCVANSNPPASLSWESLSPRLVQSSTPGLLRLPGVELADHGEYVCRAQNSLGSQDASLSLSVIRKPDVSLGMVQGGIVGAGIMALLAVCLIFIVKIYRRKSAEKEVTLAVICEVRRATLSLCQSHPGASGTAGQEDQSPPEAATPTPTEEPNLDYASLNFQRLRPQQPQAPEATQCEYTEIKTSAARASALSGDARRHQ